MQSLSATSSKWLCPHPLGTDKTAEWSQTSRQGVKLVAAHFDTFS